MSVGGWGVHARPHVTICPERGNYCERGYCSIRIILIGAGAPAGRRLSQMRYALRTLWNDRGFAAMAVLSLAIGIGANTAIFSLVNGVLLRPLDFPDPQRLTAISISTPLFRNGEPLPINLGQLVEWRRRTRAFEGIGAYRNTTMSLTGDGRPELIPGAQVSANLFNVLGVR